MDILGAKVTHRQFGIGEIVGQDERTVTVRFDEQGDKQFVYPSAFDGFLTFVDTARKRKMEALLLEIEAQTAAEKARHDEEEGRRHAAEQFETLKLKRKTTQGRKRK
ncbi:MAG TPA: hypothetical protein VN369_05735 [Terriglobales bacterium]|nr:hypothetical protein [Terriglobales bacterium]